MQHLTDIYWFEVNNSNARTMYMKPIQGWQQRHQNDWAYFGVFMVNFEQISHNILVLPLLNLNK